MRPHDKKNNRGKKVNLQPDPVPCEVALATVQLRDRAVQQIANICATTRLPPAIPATADAAQNSLGEVLADNLDLLEAGRYCDCH